MDLYLLIIIFVLVICLVVLFIKFINLKRALFISSKRLKELLETDTNLYLDYECDNKNYKELIDVLNKSLKEFKQYKNDIKSSDKKIKETISNLSHDLRTPLSVIITYLNLINRKELNNDSKTLEYLKTISKKAELLKKLVEDLFTYSVFDYEEIEIVLSEYNLNEIFTDIVFGFYDILTKKEIEVIMDISSVPVYKNLNKKAFERVIDNIISNAIKYSKNSLKICMDQQGTISFINEASGFDLVSVGKLFDRFFTVENARLQTGLGLSISKELMLRMNGDIKAELIDETLIIKLWFNE